MAKYTFHNELFLSTTADELWAFLSNPANLDVLTPDDMGGEPVGEIPSKMEPGMEVEYKISVIAGIKVVWKAAFPEVKPGHYFVDQQVKGPFKSWKHTHTIKPENSGVVMVDHIEYEPPFGLLGSLANVLFIKPKFKKLFAYRSQAFQKVFDPKN